MPRGRTSAIIAAPMSGMFDVDVFYFDAGILAQALYQLGYVIREEVKELRSARCVEEVEFTAAHPNSGNIDIGFKKLEDGSLVPVADWDKIEDTGADKKKILNEISQKYSYLVAVDEAQKMGYNLVEEKNEVDGSIKVVLRRYD